MNTDGKAMALQHGLLTTIAWDVGGEITYALEGSVFIAGAAVQWLCDGLRIAVEHCLGQRLSASLPKKR